MIQSSVGDTIALRVLTLASESGSTRVEILIGRPQPYAESTSFFCPVQIRGVGDERVLKVGGADSYQALKLAFKIITAKLESLDPDIRSRLSIDGSKDPEL